MICDTCQFSAYMQEIINRASYKSLMLGIVIGGLVSSICWLAVLWGGK